MRLTKLELENFCGFERLDLEFDPETTVLLGINGSGKTSVLEAIGVGLQTQLADRVWADVYEQRLAGRDSLIRNGQARASVRLGTESPDIGLQAISLERGRQEQVYGRSLVDGELPLLVIYRVNRNPMQREGLLTPGNWEPVSATKTALGNDHTFSELFHWFVDRENLENELRRDDPSARDPQLEAVRRAVEQLLPGYTDLRIRRPRFEGTDAASTPDLSLTKDGQMLLFRQLSEGERTLAALAADIARRAAIINPNRDPLAAEAVICIDELELHLHPQWQANALPALRRTFPNMQWIVTTHSPLVLAQVPSRCVRLLDGFKVVQTPEGTEGRDPNALLQGVFATPLRTPEIREEIRKVEALIEAEKLDDAMAALRVLEEKLGRADTDVRSLLLSIEFLGH